VGDELGKMYLLHIEDVRTLSKLDSGSLTRDITAERTIQAVGRTSGLIEALKARLASYLGRHPP
jgi:hypothetical protein